MLGYTPVDFNWKIFCINGKFNFVWRCWHERSVLRENEPAQAKTSLRAGCCYSLQSSIEVSAFIQLAFSHQHWVMASTAYPVLQTRKGNWRSLSYYRIKGLNIPTLNTGDPAKLEQYLDNFQTKSDDVFVASYLKSGKPYRCCFFFFFPILYRDCHDRKQDHWRCIWILCVRITEVVKIV